RLYPRGNTRDETARKKAVSTSRTSSTRKRLPVRIQDFIAAWNLLDRPWWGESHRSHPCAPTRSNAHAYQRGGSCSGCRCPSGSVLDGHHRAVDEQHVRSNLLGLKGSF